MMWWEEFWSLYFNCLGNKFSDFDILVCEVNFILNNIVIKIWSLFVLYVIDVVYVFVYVVDSIYNCLIINDVDCFLVKLFVKGSDV